jgi:enolase
MQIKDVKAFCILSSTGNETVEVRMDFEDGESVSASVPAGISAGKFEVRKLPADAAVKEIENVTPQLINNSWTQDDLDNKLLEYNLAGNASLPVSAAFWKAGIRSGSSPSKPVNFPKLMTLMFEGGKHGNEAISIQDNRR